MELRSFRPGLCCKNEPKVTSVYWPKDGLFFLLQAGPISSKASQYQTQVFTHLIVSKIAQTSRFFSHLEPACFTYPVKPHTASAGHWLQRAMWSCGPSVRQCSSHCWASSPRCSSSLADPPPMPSSSYGWCSLTISLWTVFLSHATLPNCSSINLVSYCLLWLYLIPWSAPNSSSPLQTGIEIAGGS